MRVVRHLLVVTILGVGAASACGDDGGDADELVGTWVATAFRDADDTVVLDPPDGPGSLTFEVDGSVAGSDGCNGFGFDAYVVDTGELRFESPQFGTLVECLAGQEYVPRFRAIVDEPVAYELDGDQLTLTGDDGIGIVFTRAEG